MFVKSVFDAETEKMSSEQRLALRMRAFNFYTTNAGKRVTMAAAVACTTQIRVPEWLTMWDTAQNQSDVDTVNDCKLTCGHYQIYSAKSMISFSLNQADFNKETRKMSDEQRSVLRALGDDFYTMIRGDAAAPPPTARSVMTNSARREREIAEQRRRERDERDEQRRRAAHVARGNLAMAARLARGNRTGGGTD